MRSAFTALNVCCARIVDGCLNASKDDGEHGGVACVVRSSNMSQKSNADIAMMGLGWMFGEEVPPC